MKAWGGKWGVPCPLIGSKNSNRPHSCLESRLFPIKACAVNGCITQILLMSNPVLSRHDLCFDRTGQWGWASKHGTRGVKMVQNVEGSSLTLCQNKLLVKTLFLFLYILPSQLRVVLIMQGQIQFFYGGKLTYIVQGTRLVMPKIICAPNTSSLKTGSRATKGVLD